MANSNEIAQIDSINKALTTLNGTLDQTSAKYLTIVKNINDSQATVKLTVQTQENLTKAQKDTADTTAKLDALGKQLQASEQKLKETEDSRMKTIIENRVATQAATQAIKDKVKAEQAEEGSLIKMRDRLKELTTQYDKTGTRTKEAAKEIDSLSREIGKAEAATNRHQRGVGGYADQLGKLGDVANKIPGPIGGVISSAEGLSTTFTGLSVTEALVLWPIALIVAAFIAIGSVFASTASGARTLKELFGQMSAIIDVLKQRTVILIDAFKAVFSGEWKKAGDLLSESVAGAGKQMGEAATKAKELVDRQMDLDRQLVLHRAEEAKEENQIQKLLFLAKDVTKSDAERLVAMKEAMKLSKDKAAAEETYAQRQLDIDVASIAQRAKTTGITEKQIADFLKLSTEEQDALLKTGGVYSAMYERIGKSGLELLAGSQEKVTQANTSFFSENKRTQSLTSGLEKSMAAEREKNQEKAVVDAKIAADKKIKEEERLSYSKTGLAEMVQKEQKVIEKDGLKSNQDFLDAKLKQAEKEAEKEKKIQEDIKQAKIDLAIAAGNAIFEFNGMALTKELNQLQVEKDNKLANTKLTTEQRAKIEAEYTKKENEIKAKQAKNDKLQALFNIAVNTAVAISKANPIVPLMILAGIAGALQAALVAAQPIPKYAKGTHSAAREGIFGEAGLEVMFPKGGGAIFADKPTYFKGDKFQGAQIKTHMETERMMSMVADRNIIVRNQTDDRLLDQMKRVETAIMNKPVAIYDKDHRQIGLGNSQHQTIYLNRLTRSN